MGNCAARCGQLSDARVHFEEALRIKRQILGNKHQSTAQTLHNIGNVLHEQNESVLALKHYQEALSIRKSCLGDDHLEVAYTLHW
jgi:tetratricopeptide (TPR) repeat protein